MTHKGHVRTGGEEMNLKVVLSGGQCVTPPPRRIKALVAVSVDSVFSVMFHAGNIL